METNSPLCTLVGDLKLDQACNLQREHELHQLLTSSPCLIGNLEGPLTRRGYASDKPSRIRMAPAHATELARLGFRALILANNHVMDYGPLGLTDTLAYLGHSGIRYVGAGRNLDEAVQPLQLSARGRRIAFLAFCCTVPANAAATPNRPGVAPVLIHSQYPVEPTWLQEEPGLPWIARTRVDLDSAKLLATAIRGAQGTADFLIVFFHWGLGLAPYHHFLLQYQREVAHLAIRSGADLVVGGHPHIIQPASRYRERWVLYSLGNFVFHGRAFTRMMSPYGAVARVYEAEGRRLGVTLGLVHLSRDGDPKLMPPREAKRVAATFGVQGLVR